MNLIEQTLYETGFCLSLEQATKLANYWTKGIILIGKERVKRYHPCYNTAMRDEETNLWKVTNRFDPKFN